jgi:D-alanyl-D-alanine carboxypeptidase
MTDKAKEIGMYNTTFKNASGLHNNYQTTTAYDMAILGLRMIKDFPQESKVFSMKEFTYRGKKYKSHNKLLYTYAGSKGIKTGFTSMSGFNLLTYVKRNDKKKGNISCDGR